MLSYFYFDDTKRIIVSGNIWIDAFHFNKILGK